MKVKFTLDEYASDLLIRIAEQHNMETDETAKLLLLGALVRRDREMRPPRVLP